MDLPKFPIIWQGQTYEVQTKQSDLARLETLFGITAGEFESKAGINTMLALGYYALKRTGVEVPPTYDLFLDGDPEIDLERLEFEELVTSGKDSIPAPSIGPSPL